MFQPFFIAISHIHRFSAYGTPLTEVFSFLYLGQKKWSSEDDLPAVKQNLQRARGKWRQMVKILGRQGADRRTVGIFYVAVVQLVLLFGSETWILIPRLQKYLEGFNHRVARQMTGMGPKRQWYGTWVYPPIGAALEIGVLKDIGLYAARLQNTVAQYIANFSIMDLFPAAERKPGMCLSRRW